MDKNRIIIPKSEIIKITENEISKFSKKIGMNKDESLNFDERMIGTPEDRHIKYPTEDDLMAIKMKDHKSKPSDDELDVIDPRDMRTPPKELIEYLQKLDDAKSILSRVAAKEHKENIRNKLYSYYEKTQKLSFELIKEFGIVHE